MKKLLSNMKSLIALAVCAALVLVAVVVTIGVIKNREKQAEIKITSTLEKIVNIQNLSTYSLTYHGVAEVPNKDKPEKMDFYVAYDATVKVGIDTGKITVATDHKTKTVTVVLPSVEITSMSISDETLDFIFVREKANKEAETYEIARTACKDDLKAELDDGHEIFALARENAIKAIEAMTQPLINQLDNDYTLIVR